MSVSWVEMLMKLYTQYLNLNFRSSVDTLTTFLLRGSLSCLHSWGSFEVWFGIKGHMTDAIYGAFRICLISPGRVGVDMNGRAAQIGRKVIGTATNWTSFAKGHKNILILRIILQLCGSMQNCISHLFCREDKTHSDFTRACLVLKIKKNIFIYIFM